MNYTRALSGNFGVEFADPDVATMSDDELRELLFALYTNRIAVLRTGGLTEVEYVDFARRIGDPLLLIPDKVAYPEIIPVDNLRENIKKTKHSYSGRGPSCLRRSDCFSRRQTS